MAFKFLPKWWKFTKSGHVDGESVAVSVCGCLSSQFRFNFSVFYQSFSRSLWPNLAKCCLLGNSFKRIIAIFRAFSGFGNILNLLWQNSMLLGKVSLLWMVMIENIILPSGHTDLSLSFSLYLVSHIPSHWLILKAPSSFKAAASMKKRTIDLIDAWKTKIFSKFAFCYSEEFFLLTIVEILPKHMPFKRYIHRGQYCYIVHMYQFTVFCL